MKNEETMKKRAHRTRKTECTHNHENTETYACIYICVYVSEEGKNPI